MQVQRKACHWQPMFSKRSLMQSRLHTPSKATFLSRPMARTCSWLFRTFWSPFSSLYLPRRRRVSLEIYPLHFLLLLGQHICCNLYLPPPSPQCSSVLSYFHCFQKSHKLYKIHGQEARVNSALLLSLLRFWAVLLVCSQQWQKSEILSYCPDLH